MKTPIAEKYAVPHRPGGKMSRFDIRALARSLGFGVLAALLLGIASHASAAGVQIAGNLANFDVRYPASLPNDLEIVIYGAGLTAADVINTYPNPFWGPAQLPHQVSINNDPTSPAFGLDCVTIRYAGPPLPAQVGQLLHFGVRLRIGAAVAHQEVWWTINGVRILRPCDPHITWICSRTFWLICISNPTPVPFYIYGCRWFPIAPAAALPQLVQLNTNIDPLLFGAPGWTPLNPPFGQVFCIQPWCRIYLKIPVTTWRPIVFQLAARNVSDSQLPLPPGTTGPNPADFDTETGNGTMVILTTRPTQEFAEDINGDGAVGLPDQNMLRTRFGTVSPDITGN